jgi:hypothetical protein
MYHPRSLCPGALAAVALLGGSTACGQFASIPTAPPDPAGEHPPFHLDLLAYPPPALPFGPVEFDTGRDDISAGFADLLRQVARHLHANREIATVELDGHADDRGSSAFNQELSRRRAESVRTALVGQGIEVDRLAVAAFGEEHPIADNTTDDGRRRNRRVDLRLLTCADPQLSPGAAGAEAGTDEPPAPAFADDDPVEDLLQAARAPLARCFGEGLWRDATLGGELALALDAGPGQITLRELRPVTRARVDAELIRCLRQVLERQAARVPPPAAASHRLVSTALYLYPGDPCGGSPVTSSGRGRGRAAP